MAKKQSEKWNKQAEAIRATQIAIDVSEQVHHFVQTQSVKSNLKASDFIRKTLGLPYKKSKIRPRLTFSLNESDYEQLGQKFNIDPSDKIAIKHAVSNLLLQMANKVQE